MLLPHIDLLQSHYTPLSKKKFGSVYPQYEPNGAKWKL